ncbi:MAG: hypothetical protein Q8K82_00415 [Gemmatimonadaceae bacterium]|nr:hypothetical protein [Gemmatimonadaceae bacterium]
MKILPALALLLGSLSVGCASVSSLPATAVEAPFSSGVEGKTGWSAYREEARFTDVTIESVFQAAKAGLGAADFALRRASLAAGVAVGEHGMTLHDWNVIAAVYFRQDDNAVLVLVMVEGSKDIGFSGDVTSGGWTGRILNGMREYLKRPD